MMYKLSIAEETFLRGKSFYHLHTLPVEDAVLFPTETDYIFVNNCIALATSQVSVRLLAYAIMDNHLHFILEADRTECLLFFEEIKMLFLRYYTRHGRASLFSKMTTGCTAISDLNQLLTEIAYVIRNPYVVRLDVNPLAYPWCSGYLYFNRMLNDGGIPADKLTGRALRAFTFSRAQVNIDSRILVNNGVANPASFVDYRRVEMFFDHARAYLMRVFRNVEAQVETAARFGERLQLNDHEMLSMAFSILQNTFGVRNVKELTEVQQKQLAKQLRDKYGGSNKQLARCTGLPLKTINAMYPLSAPNMAGPTR